MILEQTKSWLDPIQITGLLDPMSRITRFFKVSVLSMQAIAVSIFLTSALLFTNLAIAPAWSASAINWGYEGNASPSHWSELSPEFASCELGKSQSPINIDIDKLSLASPANLQFDYRPSPLEIVNNGHSIQVNYAKGSSVAIDGEKYALLQFHFHSPSEHQINGRSAPLELHLVHRQEKGATSDKGELAVLGVVLERGKGNPVIAELWKHIPEVGVTKKDNTVTVDASALLPKDKAYISYTGSLTTPPCSEGVKWLLFKSPVNIAPSQINVFAQQYPNDARPVQSLNGRLVEYHP